LITVGIRNYWYYNGGFRGDGVHLEPEEFVALVVGKEFALKKKVNRAKAVVARGTDTLDASSTRIPECTKQVAFEHDGGRCVQCDGTINLQIDHVIPAALRGSSEPTNLRILGDTAIEKRVQG
jgi:hypothetical protein